MASPFKKYKGNTMFQSYNRHIFGSAAKVRFRVGDFLSDRVSSYMKLAAKMRSTSPEMMMAAVLPTTAACMGPKGTLRMKPYGDYTVSGNLFMIGVAEPGCGKSTAFDFGMSQPLDTLAIQTGKPLGVADCSKAALLKTQKEQEGRGIICADEVSLFLSGMLKRSHTDISGERQLLLTLWGGRGHTVAYASKADIDLGSSGLCIGGFTQPDRMWDIIDDMRSSGDGLFERFLFWMLPGYHYQGLKIKEAYTTFQNKYNLKTLNPVFQEIYNLHQEPVEYHFTEDSQELINTIEDRVKMGVLEKNTAMIVDSDEEDDTVDLEPIKSIIGSKYMDQLGRLCLSIHLFSSVLEQMLASQSGQIKINKEISLETVNHGMRLLDHILHQNDIIINAMGPQSTDFVDFERSEEKAVDISYEIVKKILLEPGCLIPTRELTRRRVKGQVVSASVVSELIDMMEKNLLGNVGKVKIGKTKPASVFFKALPDEISLKSLQEYSISIEFYRQQFFLPFSGSLKIDASMVEHHPKYRQIKEFKEQSVLKALFRAPESRKAIIVSKCSNICTKYSMPVLL